MGLADFFSNDFQTSDNHSNHVLKTRYYRGDYNKIKSEIIDVSNRMGFVVEEVNDDYKEIRVENRRQEMIFNVFSISYFEQAVDIKVNTRYIIACGRGLKLIENFYKELSKNLTTVDKK